jgi:hypothetical protein
LIVWRKITFFFNLEKKKEKHLHFHTELNDTRRLNIGNSGEREEATATPSSSDVFTVRVNSAIDSLQIMLLFNSSTLSFHWFAFSKLIVVIARYRYCSNFVLILFFRVLEGITTIFSWFRKKMILSVILET